MSDNFVPVIERGIVLPPRTRPIHNVGKWQPLITAMQVGDSVKVPKVGTANTVATLIKKAGHASAVRKENGGYRVWKLAPRSPGDDRRKDGSAT